MKVRCIATGDHAFIEIGEEYEVIENREGLYQLKNGNNQHYSYGKELFEVVEDKEVVKIKEWKQLDSCSNENT